MTKLADDILMYRAKHNLSQKKFADMVGVTLQTICNIETEQQEPSRLTVAKIMLVLSKKED